MAQFDFFADGPGFLLDVQADLLYGLNTVMVVPLLPVEAAPKPAGRLNPVFTIGAERFVMATQFMAAVPRSETGKKAGSLAHHRHVIKPAIDILFDGV